MRSKRDGGATGCAARPRRRRGDALSPRAAVARRRRPRARPRARAAGGGCREHGIERVRIGWCDLHGALRGKTLMASALGDALREGVGMVSTLMLKDSRTAPPTRCSSPAWPNACPVSAGPTTCCCCPTRRVRARCPGRRAPAGCAPAVVRRRHARGLDTRRVLQRALARLAAAGFGLQCGLEVEFHIYRIECRARSDPDGRSLARRAAARSSMLHPGYNLLSEAWADLPTKRCASCSTPHRAWACRCARSRSNSGRASSRRCSTPPTR